MKIRFEAFKRKKENLDEYADVILEEILRSFNEKPSSHLMAQAVGQTRGSDKNIISSIRNIKKRDQESGNLI